MMAAGINALTSSIVRLFEKAVGPKGDDTMSQPVFFSFVFMLEFAAAITAASITGDATSLFRPSLPMSAVRSGRNR